MKFWTQRQWDALLRMTGHTKSFCVPLSIGDVYLTRMSGATHYLLEYPTHSVTLKKDVPPNSKDLFNLRIMYEMYMSM